MNWKSAFKGEYISAAEFGGREPTFTIADVRPIKLKDEKTKKERDRIIVFFRETDRGWLPAKSACYCVAAIAGSDETNAWKGKRVTLYSDPNVQLGTEIVEGVRVRGSPDMTAPIQIVIRLPKKKPHPVELVPTGKATTTAQSETAAVLGQARSVADDVPASEPDPS